MDLSIIIVNYNVRHFISQCLKSIFQSVHNNLSIEIIVVDNASVDGSNAHIETHFPKVQLIQNEDNVGFAKANNQGFTLAKGKYVLALNPDTVLEEDTLQKCFSFMEQHEDAGAIGVKMIDGNGKFLPESKRSFPSIWNAFCKLTGLSSLFPFSRLFSGYNLTYLDENQTHEIQVLCGAFMFFRKSTLEKVGYFDEAFFMYGEDIDLSFRIVNAGERIFYYPASTIIHYKGESTKKGSLNYVRTFYNAMIIYVNKHYTGGKGAIFAGILKMAIILRAAFSMFSKIVSASWQPISQLIIGCLILFCFKEWWAQYKFGDSSYYDNTPILLNIVIYNVIWVAILVAIGFFKHATWKRWLLANIIGTMLILSIYALVNTEYRTSRIIILVGTLASLMISYFLKAIQNKWRFGKFALAEQLKKRILIVGKLSSAEILEQKIQNAGLDYIIVGIISPVPTNDIGYINDLSHLKQIAEIQGANEIIFCSQDIALQKIIESMSLIAGAYKFRIAGDERLSIVGSDSRNDMGESYGVDFGYLIAQTFSRRDKRFFDFLSAVLLLLLFPITLLINKGKIKALSNTWNVLMNQLTWVGYNTQVDVLLLPPIKPCVIPVSRLTRQKQLTADEKSRVNHYYARNYTVWQDVELLFFNLNRIG